MSHTSTAMKMKLAIADLRDAFQERSSWDVYVVTSRMDDYADDLDEDELNDGDIETVKDLIDRLQGLRYERNSEVKAERYMKALEEVIGTSSALNEYRLDVEIEEQRQANAAAQVELAIEVAKLLGQGIASLSKSVVKHSRPAINKVASMAGRFRKAS